MRSLSTLLGSELALDLRNDERDRDQHGRHQIQILRLQADEVAVERQRDEEAIDDGADDDGERRPHQPARRQDALAHDHGGQADHDGADAHGDVRAALRLREEGAGQGHQGVRHGHAQQHHGAGIHALGAGHAGVGAGGADGQAPFGGEEPVHGQLGGDHDHQQQGGAGDVVGQALGLQQREQRRVVDQRDVGAAHDAQVDRIKRDHHQDAGQQVHDLEPDVEPAGDEAGRGARCRGRDRGHVGVGARGDEHGADRAAQREAAVHRQVGKAQQPERDEDAQRDQAEDQPDLDGAEQGKEGHGGWDFGKNETGAEAPAVGATFPARGREPHLTSRCGRRTSRTRRRASRPAFLRRQGSPSVPASC